MKPFLVLLLIGSLAPGRTLAQQESFALKICGSYFIRCERTIVLGDHSVLNIVRDDRQGWKVSMDIFGPGGVPEATLRDGRFSGPGANHYTVQLFEEGFDVLDLRDTRVLLRVKREDNPEKKRVDLLVWADLYLPDGKRFQCSPDDCNMPTIRMMKGNTFQGGKAAIILH